MRPVVIALCAAVALAACNPAPRGVALLAAPDVPLGAAACLGAIGRADVALRPETPMSASEIAGFVNCTATRASR